MEARVATMCVGNITAADQVNTILAAGRADLVALGRPHLADPGVVRRPQEPGEPRARARAHGVCAVVGAAVPGREGGNEGIGGSPTRARAPRDGRRAGWFGRTAGWLGGTSVAELGRVEREQPERAEARDVKRTAAAQSTARPATDPRRARSPVTGSGSCTSAPAKGSFIVVPLS